MTADAVDPELVRRVAHLARLGLPPDELGDAGRQLGSILRHFEALQSVDTTDVAPLVHALESPGAPAPDAIVAFPEPRATLLALTTHAREGLYVVPRVLEADFGEAPGEKPGRAASAAPDDADDPADDPADG